MKKLGLKCNANFDNVDFSQTNSSFYSASMRIMGIDVVANGTRFSRESVEKALPTLKNIPIVALTKIDDKDFGDHEAKLVVGDDGLKMEYNTQPIGVIPESANQWLEFVGDDCYVCSNVLLWKRQKAHEVFKDQKEFSVSMEIQVDDCNFNEVDDVLDISDFTYTAVAVLGNNVTPAFNQAQIKVFSQDTEFSDMMFELKEYMSNSLTTGGEVVQDEQKLVKDEEVVETEEQAEVEVEEVTTEPVVEEDETDEPEQEVSTDEESEVEEVVEEVVDYKALLENAEVEYGKTIAELNNDKKALEDKVYSLEQELSSLREFKLAVEVEERKQGEEELCAKFTEIANTDEFKQLFSNASSYSLEELDDKCYAILGRMAKSKKQPKQLQTKLPISKPTSSVKKQDNRYGGLLVK